MKIDDTLVMCPCDLRLKPLSEVKINWSEFEAEYGVYHSDISEMLSMSTDIEIDDKYFHVQDHVKIYWTLVDNRVKEITRNEYMEELLKYVLD